MKHYDVVTVGSATRDVFLKSRALRVIPDQSFSTGEAECFALGSKIAIDEVVFSTGGGATNTAVAFARQKFRTAFIGEVGNHDDRAKLIERELRQEKVDTALLMRDLKQPTGYSVLLLTPRGERTALVFRGASQSIAVTKVPWHRFRAKWLYITSLGGSRRDLEYVWKRAQAAKMNIAWNPGQAELALGLTRLKPLLRKAAMVSLNQEEAAGLFGLHQYQHREALDRLRQFVGGVVLITLGSDGSVAGTATQAWHCTTRLVRTVDTTGAGDAFGSGFISSYIRHPGDIPAGLQFGTSNAQSVIQHIGAKAGLLTAQRPTHRSIITSLKP